MIAPMSDPLFQPSMQESSPQASRVWDPNHYLWYAFLGGSLASAVHLMRNEQALLGKIRPLYATLAAVSVIVALASPFMFDDPSESTRLIRYVSRGSALIFMLLIRGSHMAAARRWQLRHTSFTKWTTGIGLIVALALAEGAILFALVVGGS